MKGTLVHAAVHLEAGQLIATESCPICGDTSRRTIAGVIQREPLVHLLSCQKCSGCSASHMPKPEVLAEYYSHYYRHDGPRTALADANAFARRLLRLVRLNGDNRPVRMLDFGGGDGTLGLTIARRMLADAPQRRVVFTLVDFQSPAVCERDARLLVTHRQTLEEIEGQFDLVLASAILEHIPNLETTLRRLFKLLAPDAWFYARTPYLSPLKRLFQNLDLTYPGHVHDLGAAFWNGIGETFQTRLTIVVSRPSLVETTFWRYPVRTAAAWLMKLPARMEVALLPKPRTPLWRWVGGWEVILQKMPPTD